MKNHNQIVVDNPKRKEGEKAFRSEFYPYYAGYSTSFVSCYLDSIGLRPGSIVLDPWNGSGTTTCVAASKNLSTIGIDANPVMTIVANARLLSQRTAASIKPLKRKILQGVRQNRAKTMDFTEPLSAWFYPSSAAIIRQVERSVFKALVDSNGINLVKDSLSQEVSDLAALFYVALFRTVRTYLRTIRGSNPTWVKRPNSLAHRLRPSSDTIVQEFSKQVDALEAILKTSPLQHYSSCPHKISNGLSTNLPVDSESVDAIITSPPYCTRIDYAIATAPDLAVLGYDFELDLRSLRSSMIGTPTVEKLSPDTREEWGDACHQFLSKVYSHRSKASKTYYHKSMCQYYEKMYISLVECSRVLKPSGSFALVVQDSYYKDVHNDVQRILSEMASRVGLDVVKKVDFDSRRNMGSVNIRSQYYKSTQRPIESVIIFEK